MSTSFATPESRVRAAKAIGRGERLTAEVAAAIVETLPAEFDASARGAVSGVVVAWLDESGTEKQKIGAKGEQVATDFGRGVDRVTKAVKALLKGEDDAPKPAVLRVSLSGEGGGSTVVAADHPLYAALVALVAGEIETDDAGEIAA